MKRTEFTNPGNPHPRWAPSTAEMLAQFGQPVAVLNAQPPGSTLDIGSGGVDDQIWCIDIDYRPKQQLAARVRTIRELTPQPSHAPGDFLRSALIEFSVNAELAAGTPDSDPDGQHGLSVWPPAKKPATLPFRGGGPQASCRGGIYPVTMEAPE